MSHWRHAVGTSLKAFELEDEYGLWNGSYQIETLQYISDRICRYYDVPIVDVEISNRLKGRTWGNYTKRSGKIRISRFHRKLALIIHEVCHHITGMETKSAGHHAGFKKRHETLIREFVSGRFGFFQDDLPAINTLNWYRINRKRLFDALRPKNENDLVLIQKLNRHGLNYLPEGLV